MSPRSDAVRSAVLASAFERRRGLDGFALTQQYLAQQLLTSVLQN